MKEIEDEKWIVNVEGSAMKYFQSALANMFALKIEVCAIFW